LREGRKTGKGSIKFLRRGNESRRSLSKNSNQPSQRSSQRAARRKIYRGTSKKRSSVNASENEVKFGELDRKEKKETSGKERLLKCRKKTKRNENSHNQTEKI